MSIESQLLTAILESRDLNILARNGLAEEGEWHEQVDTYRFIRKHASPSPIGYGELPSKESVLRACPHFDVIESSESPEVLCQKMHERNTKLACRKLLEDASIKFVTVDGFELSTFIDQGIDRIVQRTNARKGVGALNWTSNTMERLAEYERRSDPAYQNVIRLLWSEVEDAVAGFHRGDYVSILAWTKKGKSWIGALICLIANRAGFRVLAELAESTKHEAMFRLDTLEFGLSNRALVTGGLSEVDRIRYENDLHKLQSEGRPDFIVKTPEDWPSGLTPEQIEADIVQYKPDVVLIDQFNLMRHSDSSHGAKAETSRKMKLMFARLNVVGIMVNQANGEYGKRSDKKNDEDDVDELNPPSESDYSETIATIQDATHVLAFDSIQWRDKDGKERGKAKLVVRISRTGGAGTEVDLEWLPNDGVIRPRVAMDCF